MRPAAAGVYTVPATAGVAVGAVLEAEGETGRGGKAGEQLPSTAAAGGRRLNTDADAVELRGCGVDAAAPAAVAVAAGPIIGEDVLDVNTKEPGRLGEDDAVREVLAPVALAAAEDDPVAAAAAVAAAVATAVVIEGTKGDAVAERAGLEAAEAGGVDFGDLSAADDAAADDDDARG